MVRIEWKNSFSKVRIHGKRFMPKRPVNWRGQVWLTYPGATQHERIVVDWNTSAPIIRKDAQHILKAMLAEIVEQHGDDAIDAGFWLEVA